MKILATIKPVNYLKDIETYAYLIEIDLLSGEIVRKIKLPSASFQTKSSFMTNFAQGMVVKGSDVYVAYWNYVIVIDYQSFTIKDTFSHPLMADNHGIDTDGQYLYVTSTSIDSVLVFDLSTKKLIFRWGASNKFLQPRSVLFPYLLANNFLVKKWNIFAKRFGFYQVVASFNESLDYRSTHKSNSIYHNHHVNDVCCIDENTIYLTTKGWNDFENGSIINLDMRTRRAHFVSTPGSFKGLHDCLVLDRKIIVTESSNNSIGIQYADGSIKHKVLANESFFIRGLVKSDNGFVVGFSSTRSKDSAEARIMHYDDKFEKVLGCIKLGHLYLHSKVAVHSIQISPQM